MLKNRKIARIIRMMVGCAAIIISSYSYAETIQVPVEIKCSKNPIVSPWVIFNGETGVRYTLITEGLRVDSKEDIAEVIRTTGVGRTSGGLPMCIEARCIPSTDNGTDMSFTGSSLACNSGEGIKVKMFIPNSVNPDKYHYVGMLGITRDGEKTQELTVGNATMLRDTENVNLPLDIKLTVPKIGINSI